MIRISQLKLPVGHTTEALEKKDLSAVKDKKEELFLADRAPVLWMPGKAGFEICLCD